MAEKSSFMGEKIEFQGKKSSFKLLDKIEFPSKRTKKACVNRIWKNDLFSINDFSSHSFYVVANK